MLELIGKTVLATPQVAGQERVGDLWLISLGIADGLLILFVLAGAALVMTHETLHTRYALKEMLRGSRSPRSSSTPASRSRGR